MWRLGRFRRHVSLVIDRQAHESFRHRLVEAAGGQSLPRLGPGARANRNRCCPIDCRVVEVLETCLDLGLSNPCDLEIVLDARWPPAAGEPVCRDIRGVACVIEGTDRLEPIRGRAGCIRTLALGDALLQFAARVRATSHHRCCPIECSRGASTLFGLALRRRGQGGVEKDPQLSGNKRVQNQPRVAIELDGNPQVSSWLYRGYDPRGHER